MWGVQADHEIFKSVNQAQWLWYYHNFMKDREEAFENNRDMVEYHASFIEPEAVRKIREARDQAIEIPEEQFTSGIQRVFGRSLPGSVNKPKEKEIHKVDLGKVLTEYKLLQNIHNKPNGFSYKDWLNIKME